MTVTFAKLCGIGLFAIAFGSAMPEVHLTEHTTVPLGAASGVAVAAVTGAWFLARSLTKLSDSIEALNRRLDDLPCVKGTVVCKQEPETSHEHSA